MAIYDNAATVKAGRERLPFLTEGEYEVEVEDLGLCGAKDEYFFATHKIISAEGEKALPVGTRTTYLVGEDDYDYGLKDLIWYIRALTNNPKLTVDEGIIKSLSKNGGAAAGTRLKVSVVPKVNKKTGEVTSWLMSKFNFVAAPDKAEAA